MQKTGEEAGAVAAAVGEWERIDANPATVEITAAGTTTGRLYQRHNTGHIFRYLGSL